MTDRDKVIIGLECCLANRHNNCPYKSTDEGIDKVTTCTTYLMQDALALLRKQKPVQVIQRESMHMLFWCCGSCGVAITDGDKFCRMCGKAVKWK